MQLINAAHLSRLGPPALAFALALIGLLVMPVPTHAAARQPEAMASAGWQGRAIENPRPRLRVVDVQWPKGWSAGPVGFRSGYTRPGGSERVREVQRRLVKLGYRPGPVDGLFGPRTRAATQWFQFKHGLPTNGRVNRSTLAVLTARSDHKPLPTKPRERSTDTTHTAGHDGGRARAATGPRAGPGAGPGTGRRQLRQDRPRAAPARAGTRARHHHRAARARAAASDKGPGAADTAHRDPAAGARAAVLLPRAVDRDRADSRTGAPPSEARAEAGSRSARLRSGRVEWP